MPTIGVNAAAPRRRPAARLVKRKLSKRKLLLTRRKLSRLLSRKSRPPSQPMSPRSRKRSPEALSKPKVSQQRVRLKWRLRRLTRRRDSRTSTDGAVGGDEAGAGGTACPTPPDNRVPRRVQRLPKKSRRLSKMRPKKNPERRRPTRYNPTL